MSLGTKSNKGSDRNTEDLSDILLMSGTASGKIADTDLKLDQYFRSFFTEERLADFKPVKFKDPYQLIVDNLPHMAFLKNLDSVYMTCNSQLADFIGISQSDIIGKTDFDLFPHALALKFQFEDQMTLEQGKARQYIQDFHRKDRKLFLQMTKIPLQDKTGKNLGLIGMICEITDAPSLKEIIGHGHLPKDILVENNPDIVYRLDFFGSDSFISENIHQLTGYLPEEHLKLSLREQFENESVNVFMEMIGFYREAVKSPIPISDRTKYYKKVDLELKRKGGKSVWVESINSLSFAETGEVNGIVGMYRNINDRKVLEFQVHEALEQSKKNSQAQAQIISTISHEFRTPISVLQSNLQMLLQHRNNLDDSMLDDIFDLSLEAIKALNNSLTSISFLAKNQKKAFNLVPQEIHLNQFIKKLVRELICIPEYANRIVHTVKLDQPHYQLDPELMKHILTNLLSNGLNYSPADKKVRLRVEERDGQLYFSIKDEGIGIPEEDIGRIFESFYRASNAGGIKGTGLGLAIVKECVTLHGGNIRIYSKRDEGTEVEITIPVIDG